VSVAVVIAVRDGGALIDRCLEAVQAEAGPIGAEVIVVDDCSTDDTSARSQALGARVIRLPEPAGPYAARNAGWRSGQAEVIAFTDVRARPRAGWLDALRTTVAEPSVAIAGGDVVIEWGPRAAQRWAHRNQPLLARHGRELEFLPYFPGCNLATSRRVLEALDGFVEDRSGGDVDLCWRAQLAGLGSVSVAEGAVVDWEPRQTVREAARQFARYGRWNPVLYRRFAAVGCVPPSPPSLLRQGALELAGLAGSVVRRRDVAADFVDRLCRMTYWTAYVGAARSGATPVTNRTER
jgi:glycosyltransferase involved in cell wall biosynthesis